MNFFHHKDLGNHLLQLCPKFVKHPVYELNYFVHSLEKLTLQSDETKNVKMDWTCDSIERREKRRGF